MVPKQMLLRRNKTLLLSTATELAQQWLAILELWIHCAILQALEF